MTILIPVVGILCTTLFLLLWYPKQIKTGRLAALYTVDFARSLSSLDPKSLEYKLLASGLNISLSPFASCALLPVCLGWSSRGCFYQVCQQL